MNYRKSGYASLKKIPEIRKSVNQQNFMTLILLTGNVIIYKRVHCLQGYAVLNVGESIARANYLLWAKVA